MKNSSYDPRARIKSIRLVVEMEDGTTHVVETGANARGIQASWDAQVTPPAHNADLRVTIDAHHTLELSASWSAPVSAAAPAHQPA